MKRDNYERALRAAAQVSCLSLPMLGACGESPIIVPVADAAVGTGGGYDEELSEAECRQALSAAYPNGDPNWFVPTPTPRVDTDVPVAVLVDCCSDLVVTDNLGLRDTGCCSLNNEVGGVQDIGVACTPWGPPMPRAMRRKVLA